MYLRYNFGLIFDKVFNSNEDYSPNCSTYGDSLRLSKEKEEDEMKKFSKLLIVSTFGREDNWFSDCTYWDNKEGVEKHCGRRIVNPSKDCYITMDDLEEYNGYNLEI